MKRIIAIIMAAVMLLSLVACGGSGGNTEPEKEAAEESAQTDVKAPEKEEQEEEETPAEQIQVDEGLFLVDITLPASFFEDETEEEIIAAAEEEGLGKCTVNDDGSVTYSMTKAEQKELLNDYKASIDELIADLLEGEEAVESFQSIECNGNYSQIDIVVDGELFTAWDNFYALSFYMIGAYYQIFDGTDTEDVDVVVNFIDGETEEVISSSSYKQFMENAEDSAEET